MVSLVKIDVNDIFTEYAKQVRANKRLKILAMLGCVYIASQAVDIKQKDKEIESLKRENRELKNMKGE